MTRSPTVWSLGSILVDFTVEVPALPERGGDRLATATRTEAGGGFNLVAAVARQGVRCVYAGPHGTGPYGDQVRAALSAEGVPAVGRRRDHPDTGFCITLVEPDGERTFVTMPGAEAELDPVELGLLHPFAGDLVSLSGYDLAYPASGAVLAGWVEPLPPGVTVVLDPGPLVLEIPEALRSRVLHRVSVLTMNRREAGLLAAVPEPEVGADLLSAVRRASGLPADALLVVRAGSAGCIATGGALGPDVVRVPAPTVTAVDTTGAGDAHTGVLLAALARGIDPVTALTLANRAAAVSVTRVGPATAPTVIHS
jgi:sugar/nucleoside kinase (ribokinase family)